MIAKHTLDSRKANAGSVSLPRSKADRMAGESTSSRNRKTIAASLRLCLGGKFCLNKFCATLTASTIARSELMGKKRTQDPGVPLTCGEAELKKAPDVPGLRVS